MQICVELLHKKIFVVRVSLRHILWINCVLAKTMSEVHWWMQRDSHVGRKRSNYIHMCNMWMEWYVGSVCVKCRLKLYVRECKSHEMWLHRDSCIGRNRIRLVWTSLRRFICSLRPDFANGTVMKPDNQAHAFPFAWRDSWPHCAIRMIS